MPDIRPKYAGKINSSSGCSRIIPTQNPRTISLGLLATYHGVVTILINLTQGQTYVGTATIGPDSWTFQLYEFSAGVWRLDCDSPTANGGSPGYTFFEIYQPGLPLDARATRLNWTLFDAIAEAYFDVNEIYVRPAAPNILPQGPA